MQFPYIEDPNIDPKILLVLIMGTPHKGTPNLRKPPYASIRKAPIPKTPLLRCIASLFNRRTVVPDKVIWVYSHPEVDRTWSTWRSYYIGVVYGYIGMTEKKMESTGDLLYASCGCMPSRHPLRKTWTPRDLQRNPMWTQSIYDVGTWTFSDHPNKHPFANLP